MAELYKQRCLKCKAEYQDTDPDPYFCEPCKVERKKVSERIDAQFAGRASTPVETELQSYDRQLREAREKGMRFPSFNSI